MTLADLKTVLNVSINRDDLAPFYKDWINQALLRIYQDFSWNAMRNLADVTIPAGSSFASLPSDFKELTPARPPIHLKGTDGSLSPVNVERREDIIRQKGTYVTPVGVNPHVSVSVYIANDGDSWTLNLLNETTTAATFSVSYFRFLPSLENDNDSNYITRTYPEMVEARLKARAFSVINDPLSLAANGEYLLYLKAASSEDAKRSTRGRILRMGGE